MTLKMKIEWCVRKFDSLIAGVYVFWKCRLLVLYDDDMRTFPRKQDSSLIHMKTRGQCLDCDSHLKARGSKPVTSKDLFDTAAVHPLSLFFRLEEFRMLNNFLVIFWISSNYFFSSKWRRSAMIKWKWPSWIGWQRTWINDWNLSFV